MSPNPYCACGMETDAGCAYACHNPGCYHVMAQHRDRRGSCKIRSCDCGEFVTAEQYEREGEAAEEAEEVERGEADDK